MQWQSNGAGSKGSLPTPKRTLDQNARLWSIADDISKSGMEWGGLKLSKENWLRLLVAGVYKQKLVPALNGDGFVFVNASTSRMTKAQISEVIAFAEAWCVANNIELSDGLQESTTP